MDIILTGRTEPFQSQMVHESCIFNQIDHILCKKDELKKRCGLFGQHMPSEKAAFISKSNELNSLSAKFYKTIFAVGSDTLLPCVGFGSRTHGREDFVQLL